MVTLHYIIVWIPWSAYCGTHRKHNNAYNLQIDYFYLPQKELALIQLGSVGLEGCISFVNKRNPNEKVKNINSIMANLNLGQDVANKGKGNRQLLI